MVNRGRTNKAPKLRKARGEGHSRHAEILDAARRLFVQAGYEAATMRKIAESVGMTTTGVYVYFPTKEAILAALAESTFLDLIETLAAARKSHVDPLPAFEAELRAYIAFGLSRPDEYRLAFMAKAIGAPAPGRPTAAATKPEAATRSFAVLHDELAALMTAGLVAAGDPKLIAEVVWASLHGMVALCIEQPKFPASGRVKVTNALIKQILSGLAAVR